MYYDEDIISELSRDECWAALRGEEFGRLAYMLGNQVNLVPLNYAVDGDTLLFRTAEGSKLLGVVMNGVARSQRGGGYSYGYGYESTYHKSHDKYLQGTGKGGKKSRRAARAKKG